MTNLSELSAISPIDGRYRNKVENLQDYFSEAALIRYRLRVEIEYFIALYQIPLPQLDGFHHKHYPAIRAIYKNFTDEDAQAIKDIEKVTNHDVKAVEYFIKAKFEELGFGEFKEFIHFGLTSQDINNTAVPLSMREAYRNEIWPHLNNVLEKLIVLANTWKDVPMLAHTHGQPASPTTLGKELYVYVDRLEQQIDLLKSVPFSGKFGGATGNFNAHYAAYPKVNWILFANDFLENKLKLQRQQVTTQIEHYDNMAAFFDGLKRINNILTDLCRDMWAYISMDYFKQVIKKGEVGSSAMPHKVNPIDFENAEGNFGVANALFEFFASKLPISRLQRDLTDSTVTRNIGIAFAYSSIAYQSLLKGLNKLLLNEQKLYDDLDKNWAVVAEAIQTILRREGYPNPYEALKNLTRNNALITKDSITDFIGQLAVSDEIKTELKNITPHNYTGISPFMGE